MKKLHFSNATEGMVWQERNCENCAKYEKESIQEKDAGCKAAFYIDLGYISGKLPPVVHQITGGLDKCKSFKSATLAEWMKK